MGATKGATIMITIHQFTMLNFEEFQIQIACTGQWSRRQNPDVCLLFIIGRPVFGLAQARAGFSNSNLGKIHHNIRALFIISYCEFPTHCTNYPSQEPRADFVIRIHSKQLQYCHHSFSSTPVHAPPLRLASLATDWNRLRSFAFKLKLQLPQLQLCPQRMQYVSTKRQRAHPRRLYRDAGDYK